MLPFLETKIECDTLLAAVDAHEIGAFPVEKGTESARLVTLPGQLYLDDIRSQISENHGRKWTGEDARKVDDPYASQNAASLFVCRFRHFTHRRSHHHFEEPESDRRRRPV